MVNPQTTSRGATKFAAIPLAIAYVAVPLGLALAHFFSSSPEVSPYLPWLVLAGLGTCFAMLRRTSKVPVKKRFVFEVALFLVLVTILCLYTRDIFRPFMVYMPYVSEFLPLIFILFCALWIKTFGLPDRSDFQRYGALLGALCLVDLVGEAVVYHAVPTIRWLGNADVLAGLLLVSLCASLRSGDNEGGAYEPDQGQGVWRGLILLGLAACLSRTGLFAAAWIFLCFGRGRKRVRVTGALVLLALIGCTFLLPTTPSDAIRYVDYWLWVEAIRFFTETPMLLFTGFTIDNPLPIVFPAGMGGIWEAATNSPSMMGVYLSQIPSFWLRLTLAWGISAPLLFLVIVFILLFRRLTRMGAGLVAALFAQGMITPLMYDPAMAAIIGFAFFLALSNSERVLNVKVDVLPEEVTAPAPEASSDPDPVEEWNMRPL